MMEDDTRIELIENYGVEPPVMVDTEFDDTTRYLVIKVPLPDHVLPRDHDLFMEAASKLGENFALFMRKHMDYGPRNISDFGELGVLVRLNDKVQRLRNLLLNKKEPENEAVYDSWRDIANYGLIGQLLNMEVWPNE